MEDIIMRRETRRLKILQNSSKRLQKISGVEQKKIRITSRPDEFDQNDDDSLNSPDSVPNILYSVEAEPRSERIAPQSATKPAATSSLREDSIHHFLIFGLAFFVNTQILFLSTFIETSNLNKIFIPFFLYELYTYFQRKDEKKADGNFLQLLIQNRLRAPGLRYVFQVVNFLAPLVQDAMLYFFSFALCEFLKRIALS